MNIFAMKDIVADKLNSELRYNGLAELDNDDLWTIAKTLEIVQQHQELVNPSKLDMTDNRVVKLMDEIEECDNKLERLQKEDQAHKLAELKKALLEKQLKEFENIKKEGMKFDGQDADGKPLKARWDLIPLETLTDTAMVLAFGAKKYEDWNWTKVEKAVPRYFAAMMRHLTAWQAGEDVDPETNLSHLSHAMCCLIFVIWHTQHSNTDLEWLR